MIVPASGHHVRCIPWMQMGTFKKEIGFLCGLKFFASNIFWGEYLQSSLHLMLQIWWNHYCERCANKKWCASKQTGLLHSCLGKLCLHLYLVVPLISARVTLISTRVSAHFQAILLNLTKFTQAIRIWSFVMYFSEHTYVNFDSNLNKKFTKNQLGVS